MLRSGRGVFGAIELVSRKTPTTTAVSKTGNDQNDKIQAPAIVEQRQYQRNGQRRGQNFADEKSGRVDRRGETDGLRETKLRTSGGNVGCMIETPAAMTMVEANRNVASAIAPRAAPPSAVSSKPTSKAGNRPNRAINSEPGTAAIANSIGGRLDSQPICVSDRCRSACNSGMTGGVASTVSRRHAPDSQSRRRGIRRGLMMALLILGALAGTGWAPAYMIRGRDQGPQPPPCFDLPALPEWLSEKPGAKQSKVQRPYLSPV